MRRTKPFPRVADPASRALLLGSVKLKADHPAPAEELYLSPLFRRRRAYAEDSGLPWFVLSPKWGLLTPDQVIAPYDQAMAGQSVADRRVWALRVVQQLGSALGPLPGWVFEVHAGAAYVEPLAVALRAEDATVVAPLQGLTQGGHLAWYAAEVRQAGSRRGRRC